jgi:lysophospholipase L1-like esterase
MKSKYGVAIDQAGELEMVGQLHPGVDHPQSFDEMMLLIELNTQAQKILCEGDSWFSMGAIPANNLLFELRFTRRTVLCNLAKPGDTICNMSSISRNPLLSQSMDEVKWDAILLSGGGNDLIERVGKIIRPPAAGAGGSLNDYVNTVELTTFEKAVREGFQEIIQQRNSSKKNAQTPIILHTYDYPTPRDAPSKFLGMFSVSGPWLYPAMHAVPNGLWLPLSDYLFDRLSKVLINLHSPSNNVYVIANTHHTLVRAACVTGTSNDWENEIHPTRDGYAKLSQVVSPEIEHVLRP